MAPVTASAASGDAFPASNTSFLNTSRNSNSANSNTKGNVNTANSSENVTNINGHMERREPVVIPISLRLGSSQSPALQRVLLPEEMRKVALFQQELNTLDFTKMNPDLKQIQITGVCGEGAFGTVFEALLFTKSNSSNISKVAIKKVCQDARYKNRELDILKEVSTFRSPYIVELKFHFYTAVPNSQNVFLNLILEFMPFTLSSLVSAYNAQKMFLPESVIRSLMFQAFNALKFLDTLDLCHRDIKPPNLLVALNPLDGKLVELKLKLADFGSAKKLNQNEPNLSYICSRYYRAPELIFGSTFYSTKVDVWGMGCVLGEILARGTPIFQGRNQTEVVVEMLKILGMPTDSEFKEIIAARGTAANAGEKDNVVSIRTIKKYKVTKAGVSVLASPTTWSNKFREELCEVLEKILVFSPTNRYSAKQTLELQLFRDVDHIVETS